MTPALTPELAVAYVRDLSADVTGVVVLDGGGARLAGPEALAAPARAFAEAAAGRPDVAVRVPAGVVFAATTREHAVVVAAGPLSLVGPTRLDARTAVEALAGPAPALVSVASAGEAPADELRQAAEAVILATHGAI